MKTNLKRFIAGATMTILASAFSGCSPMVIAPSRPNPVVYTSTIYTPAPVQTVEAMPVVPVWAPPYTYVTEVHYYYFPDYMMYYDLFEQHYCYFDGFNWLHVTMLPSMPLFYGFNPYSAYMVVLNHSAYQPWIKHDFYVQQYPSGYYKTMYAPRTSLGNNTVLRAYDENQSRPVFVDKRSNKEVKVSYDARPPRSSVSNNSTNNNSSISSSPGRTTSVDRSENMKSRSERPEKNKALPDQWNNNSSRQQAPMNSSSHETTKNNNPREANTSRAGKNHGDVAQGSMNNNQPVIRSNDSRTTTKNSKANEHTGRIIIENSKANHNSREQNKGKQTDKRSK